MDTIIVRNLELHALHGYYEEERVEGRTFVVDVDAFVPTVRAGQTDELAETVDYRDICAAVLSVMEGESRHLIEALAEEISVAILERIGLIERVRISIRKRATGVPGNPEFVGVVIERGR